MGKNLAYHMEELRIARDKSSAAHIMPILKERHRIVLDVGCGMGQTLIASNLADGAVGYGVDVDEESIEEGKKFCPPNIVLSVGSGEDLNFPNDMFDCVMCRVALPYMNVRKSLSEMHRVTKPGGDIWLVLHPFPMWKARFLRSLRAGRLKDALYCGFVVGNSFLQHWVAKQMRVGGRTETFQTVASIRRDLLRAGFDSVDVSLDPFVAQARKN